jgi:hypothetical protein
MPSGGRHAGCRRRTIAPVRQGPRCTSVAPTVPGGRRARRPGTSPATEPRRAATTDCPCRPGELQRGVHLDRCLSPAPWWCSSPIVPQSPQSPRRVAPAHCCAGAPQNRPCPLSRQPAQASPEGVRAGKGAFPLPLSTSRRWQWVCMRRFAVRSSGVPAPQAVTACLRIALRVAVSHCSRSVGVCGSWSACSSSPPQSGRRPCLPQAAFVSHTPVQPSGGGTRPATGSVHASLRAPSQVTSAHPYSDTATPILGRHRGSGRCRVVPPLVEPCQLVTHSPTGRIGDAGAHGEHINRPPAEA